jgi:hypothetical protein
VNGSDCASRKEKGNSEIAFREDEILPYEKWLVAFQNNFSPTFLEDTVFIRQFFAPGFYEAYDIVATYAEKSQVEILWFLEKRECGIPYLNSEYPELESLCTYCNNFFNFHDPIPCPDPQCFAKFCSRNCLQAHIDFKHK